MTERLAANHLMSPNEWRASTGGEVAWGRVLHATPRETELILHCLEEHRDEYAGFYEAVAAQVEAICAEYFAYVQNWLATGHNLDTDPSQGME